MNNIYEDGDDDDLDTIVEPQITYYSCSSTRGVSTLLSSRQKNPIKMRDLSFTQISPDSSFSLCNTIMLPTITNEESIEIKNDDTLKEKEKNHISLVKDKTTNNSLSSNWEIKENENISLQKDNEQTMSKSFILDKFDNSLSYNYKINKSDNNIKKLKNNSVINEPYNNNQQNIDSENEKENKDESEDQKKENKFEAESSNILYRVKSVRIPSKFMDKSDNLKKSTKLRNKNPTLEIKISNNINNNNKIKLKNLKKKKEISFEKSKSLIDDPNNKKSKKDKEIAYKLKTAKNCNNFFHHNKKEKAIYFKKIIKKVINERMHEINNNNESEDDSKKNEKKIKKEEMKKDNKLTKSKNLIESSNKIKINKSFHLKRCFNMLKEYIKNENNRREDDEMNNNLNIDKEISTKEKGKKNQEKKSLFKSDNEKVELEKTINNKNESSPKEENKIINYIKKNTIEQIKSKLKKNKDKESNKISSISKKELCVSFKNLNPNESKNKAKIKVKSENILRKERSNSFNFDEQNKEEDGFCKKISDNIIMNKNSKEEKNKKKSNRKLTDFENELKNNKRKMQFNLFSKDKFTNTEFSDSDYLKYTLNCMDLILDINMEKQVRLKNKVNFNFPNSKKKKIEKKIALFDLDETLVHCTGDIRTTKENYQNVIEIKLPGKQEIQVGINVRPYWKQTFNLIKKCYHIVIYTASHQAYADAVLDFMDPKKKYFKYRLYRNNCSLIDVDGAKFYVKDLEILNEKYNLKDIVVVDNSVLSFAYHLHNGIPILPYYDEDEDGSLYVVGLYLMHIFNQKDLREENKKHINLDSFLEEAKRKKEENKSSEEEEDEEDEVQSNENIKDKETKMIMEKSNEKKDNNNNEGCINKKNLERKVSFNPRNTISQLSSHLLRKKSQLFENQKLKSKSKLLKMYYEVNDDSPKSVHFDIKKGNLFDINRIKSCKKLSSTNNIFNINKNEDKDEKKDTDIIFVDNNNIDNNSEDIDCRSDHDFFKGQNYQNNKDSESEEGVLKRGMTIREDNACNLKIDKNRIKHKLGFIRSNFYNMFKI